MLQKVRNFFSRKHISAGTRFDSSPTDHDAIARGNRRWKINWAEPIGLKECPYAVRWVFETPAFSIRVHKWISHDDPRYKHDHAWDFITFVLKGGYVDVGDKEDHLKRFSLRYRRSSHIHTVYPDDGGCWTILLTGPIVRQYGFWIGERFRRASKFFYIYGHHPCD